MSDLRELSDEQYLQAILWAAFGPRREVTDHARHEAGHAVVALALGYGVETVSVVPTLVGGQRWLGNTELYAPSPPPAHDQAVMAWAGVVAERNTVGGGADFDELAALCLSQAARDAAFSHARRLVDEHAEQIEAVVQALLREQTLTGAQVAELVQAV